MKEPREDDERLSALLEGRIEGRQREELLAHLAEADDDYEVFTNTASVLRALEEEDALARRRVPPPRMRRRAWPAARTLVVMAGTVVLLLAAGWLLSRRGGSAPADYPLRLAVDVEAANWSPWVPRGTVRGGDQRRSREARAVYAGARLVDLAVAVRMRDTAQISELARTLQIELDGRTNPDAPLSRIAARPDAPKDTLDAFIEQATGEYAKLGRDALELGAWVEAARVAARARNAGFFADGPTDGMLRRAEGLARGDAMAEEAVAAVGEAVPSGSRDPDWNELAKRSETMLARLTHTGVPSPRT